MKIIYPDISEVTSATSEAANFAYANINDDRLAVNWKAGATGAATILGEALGTPVDAIALFGLEADTVTIEIYSDSLRTVLVDSLTKTTLFADEFSLGSTPDQFLDALWFEFASTTNVYYTVIVDRGSPDVAKLGKIAVGKRHELPNMNYGGDDFFIDHSIVMKLKHGADFVRSKRVSRETKGRLEIPVSSYGRDLYQALKRLFKSAQRTTPMAMLLLDGMLDDASNTLDHEYTAWVRIDKFSPKEGQYSHSTIDFTLKEYL